MGQKTVISSPLDLFAVS